ncbi:hypothetical protein A2W14_02100 [Candidatus Gottesmanbacteria bacterium RBG_16_37_8]|uniref:PIN domain-containing protein n=1 Tax=Candidatus Gottesmanbacteria bacterium RBG_16_37_8 TaxID=1798371 RepID=A0A1F5YSJ2_9BACT|nr:MAG: hypothetical protein A2W14_02100 [Candidatus Gottesmanbacteria bacterium RBG_16_37_8]
MKRSRQIVVDSSVIVKWLSSQDEKWLNQADKLLKDCQDGKVKLHTPQLAKYEVGNALLYKRMDIPSTYASFATLYVIPIIYHEETVDDAGQSMEIAKEANITYYDSVFLNLTKKLGAKLVTDNPKHHKKFKSIKVISISKYI